MLFASEKFPDTIRPWEMFTFTSPLLRWTRHFTYAAPSCVLRASSSSMNTDAEQPDAVGILHLYSYKSTFVHLMVVHFFYVDLFFTLVVFFKQNSRSFGFDSHRRHMPLPHLRWSTSVTAEWTPLTGITESGLCLLVRVVLFVSLHTETCPLFANIVDVEWCWTWVCVAPNLAEVAIPNALAPRTR